MPKTKLTLKGAIKQRNEFKRLFKASAESADKNKEQYIQAAKRRDELRKELSFLMERLTFVENELIEANEDNSRLDDVILALGGVVGKQRSMLKRRNVNDQLNRNFQAMEECNTIR